ncbi:hypothetical protein [Stenotrophomonas sp.]|uniref:hypothetical protein n=1 Tax=Stenotrophomonas sp. TaxID=69392 RepID=UPI002D2AD24D|nr:hypothetical protein [Stenotrophomonas sp.]HYQ21905.1 hypothetical protein [Stenotrophomonas sp.]
MKVLLQEQYMQVGVQKAELAQLLAGESVENLTRFGGSGGWALALSLHDGDQAVLLDGGTYCRLVLPRAALQALGDGPGFQRTLDLDDGTLLHLHVEVAPGEGGG